jgi:flagellar basal-body rod protein FlgF
MSNTQYNNPSVGSLYDAMQHSIKRIGIIQANMENFNTVGYKTVLSDSVLFSETLKDVFRDESQGSFVPTQQKLDLAITKPNAFFLVEDIDGPVRSRDGQFHVSQEGKIVDIQNRELVILDQNPNKSIADALTRNNDVEINKNGELRIDGELYGRVAIDYESTGPGDQAYILQGKLEASNVDLQENILKLMQVKRHIDTVQGVLSMELNVDKALIETYGRNV